MRIVRKKKKEKKKTSSQYIYYYFHETRAEGRHGETSQHVTSSWSGWLGWLGWPSGKTRCCLWSLWLQVCKEATWSPAPLQCAWTAG